MTSEELKKKEEKKKRLKADIITCIITIVIGVVIFLLYYYLRGHHLIDAVNGCSLTAVIIISAALLVLVARLGAFDTFVYGFKQLGAVFFTKNPRKYNNMGEYVQQKNIERQSKGKYYIPMLIASAPFVIATVVLQIIYSSI